MNDANDCKNDAKISAGLGIKTLFRIVEIKLGAYEGTCIGAVLKNNLCEARG